MKTERAKEAVRRWRELQGRRGQWSQHWEDLAWLMLPSRSGFVTQFIEGEPRTDNLYDGTAMRAARMLANALGTMLHTGRKLKVDDEDEDNLPEDARLWIAATERRYQAALDDPRSRLYQARAETDLDLVVFGTGNLFIGEGRRLNHLLFQSIGLKDATPVFDEEGNPDGMFRMRRFSVRQLVGMFGEDRLGEKAAQLLRDDKPDEKLDYLHAVLPRDEMSQGGGLARNMPYVSIWIEVGSEDEVGAGGFHEFPFVVPRWDTTSGEDYGRSPGMIALPDANTAQAMGETILIAGQRVADPPFMAPADMSFPELNTFPGGISYYDIEAAAAIRGNPFFPLDTGANLPLSREMQNDTRDAIFNAFYRNVLNLPIDGPHMTAEEIRARKEEFIREVGGTLGRLEADYPARVDERAFKVMLRGGGFLPVPRSLQGRNVRFEYQSVLKKLRQQIDAAAARMLVVEAQSMAPHWPEATDNIDPDEYLRMQAEAAAIPDKVMRAREKVDELRHRRQAQAQRAAQMQAAMSVAEGAGKAAPMVKAIGDMRRPAA